MTTTAKQYNGWTNYETWVVKLWIDNDAGSYEYWREETRAAINEAEAGTVLTKQEAARYDLAGRLQSSHEDSRPAEVCGASLWTDLLSAALSEVNWSEIAASLIEDAEQDEA